MQKDATQALVFAVSNLENKCATYVEIIIPPFFDPIKSSMNDTLVIDLIIQLGI